MLENAIVTVGPAGADLVGADNGVIQAAVDRVAALGGGTVALQPGTYVMHDSVHLRSGVTLKGAGAETVLRKAPCVSSALSADLGYGHFDVSLAEPDRLAVGMGVHIHDDRSGGFYDTVASLTWRAGDRFGLSRMLNHDYSRAQNARVVSLFPVVSCCFVKDAAVESLSIDGNAAENERLNGCRGGGIFLQQAHRVSIRKVEVRDFNGDGISFQQCSHLLIEDSLCEGNTGHGLHPGSGSVAPVMRRVRCTNNGVDGIFYCLRVTYSLCEECELVGNQHDGISIGGRDTNQLIRNNIVRGNGRHGVYFRQGDLAMAGHCNLLEGNLLENNCRTEGEAEICIDGATRDVHIVRNRIRTDGAALRVCEEASPVVFHGNAVEAGEAMTVLGPSGSVVESAPSEGLPVGPDAAPTAACAHLADCG